MGPHRTPSKPHNNPPIIDTNILMLASVNGAHMSYYNPWALKN